MTPDSAVDAVETAFRAAYARDWRTLFGVLDPAAVEQFKQQQRLAPEASPLRWLSRSGSVAALLVASALAASHPVGAQTPCKSPMTQSAMTRCAGETANTAQRRLDALLAELAKSLDSARFRELRTIQTDWAKNADAHCRWDAASYEGGSVQPMWYANCMEGEIVSRIDNIRTHLCGDDAGMAGTCPAAERYNPSRKSKWR